MDNRKQNSSNRSKSANMEKTTYLSLLGGFLAFLLPLGYVLAYIHQVGFCDFFGIPHELIQLNWTITLISISGALAGVLVVGGLFYIPRLFNKGEVGPRKWRAIYTILVFFLMLYFAIRYATVEEARILLFFSVYFLLLIWLLPYITQRNIHGYRKKLIAEDESLKHKLLRTSQILTYVILGLSLLVIFAGFANLEGRALAMREQAWYTPSTHPQSVVLRIYGENIICAPVSSERMITVQDKSVKMYYIDRAYFAIKLSDQPPTVLKPDKVGYLRLPENR